MSNWKLDNHIVGKPYNLTQENMNAMIADIEELVREKKKLQQTVLDFQTRYREALESIASSYVLEGVKKDCESCGYDGFIQLEHNNLCVYKIAREALKGEE